MISMNLIINKNVVTPLMIILFTASCSATTIHVSANGSDEDSGSSRAPLKSLARAAELAMPGDTVIIGDGVYRETLSPEHSGKPGSPITFMAAPGAHPVITGCDEIKEWKREKGDRWVASVEWDLGPGNNQLYVNGEPLTEARHPNKISTGLMEHDLEPLRFPTNGVASGAAFATNTSNHWEGAYFFGHGYEAWAFQCARIASSYADRLVFDPKTQSDPWFEKPMRHGDATRLAKGEGAGFVFGLPKCLDAPGEWFWLDKKVWMIPPAGVAPDSQLVEARLRMRTLNIEDKNNIVVRGLKFVAGTMQIKGNNNVLENCEGLYLSHFMTFTDGYARNGGRDDGIAVAVEGEGNVLRGCHIAKTAGCGIGLLGSGNLVTRCLVEDIDYAGTYGACVNVGGEKQRIVFNTLRRTGRDCLQINSNTSISSGGHRVLLNDISTPGLVCKDTGIIYFFGTNGDAADGTGTRIAYNWVHDNLFPVPAPGIYLDNYVRNFLVDHNVVWNVPHDAGIRINAPTDSNRVFNNTLFRTLSVGSYTHNAFPHYNPEPSYWTNSNQYSIVKCNNLELGNDPQSQLNNPAAFDFTLKPAAPAIGAGKVIPGIAAAMEGNQPDLGAYQTGLPPWKPGHEGHADPRLLSRLNLEPSACE
jgi:hypothetical protein